MRFVTFLPGVIGWRGDSPERIGVGTGAAWHERWRVGLERGSRHLLLGGLLMVAGSCSPDIPTAGADLPEVAGEWEYTAADMRAIGRSEGPVCGISEMTLQLGPWRPTGFFGRSSGGVLICTAELEAISGPLPSYPVRRGGAVLNFVAFDLGTPEWRHDGTIVGDTMSGRVRLQQGRLELEGTWRAVFLGPGTGFRDPEAALSTSN